MAQAKYEIRRKCPICGAVFQIRTIDAVYCSKQCSDVAYKRKKDREAKEAKYEELAKEIPDIREYLSVQEAVAVYCVERDTLYREIRKGKIPAVNLGTNMEHHKHLGCCPSITIDKHPCDALPILSCPFLCISFFCWCKGTNKSSSHQISRLLSVHN